MLNCEIVWMTLKTPILLFPVNVMLNISVESTDLPRPQSHAITFWGTKEVIVSLPSRALRSFPSSPSGDRAVLFLAFLSPFSALHWALGKPVEEAVNGESPSTHRGINTIVNCAKNLTSKSSWLPATMDWHGKQEKWEIQRGVLLLIIKDCVNRTEKSEAKNCITAFSSIIAF